MPHGERRALVGHPMLKLPLTRETGELARSATVLPNERAVVGGASGVQLGIGPRWIGRFPPSGSDLIKRGADLRVERSGCLRLAELVDPVVEGRFALRRVGPVARLPTVRLDERKPGTCPLTLIVQSERSRHVLSVTESSSCATLGVKFAACVAHSTASRPSPLPCPNRPLP